MKKKLSVKWSPIDHNFPFQYVTHKKCVIWLSKPPFVYWITMPTLSSYLTQYIGLYSTDVDSSHSTWYFYNTITLILDHVATLDFTPIPHRTLYIIRVNSSNSFPLAILDQTNNFQYLKPQVPVFGKEDVIKFTKSYEAFCLILVSRWAPETLLQLFNITASQQTGRPLETIVHIRFRTESSLKRNWKKLFTLPIAKYIHLWDHTQNHYGKTS